MSGGEHQAVGAVVLAAGRSTRMGRQKMTLPWEGTTVIGQVVQVLSSAGIDEIVVVTGGAHQEVMDALQGESSKIVYNPDYLQGEMLSSLQLGLQSLKGQLDAALVVLGDQPQIERGVVKVLLQEYAPRRPRLVVPSYRMRRGHPWILDRSLWADVLALKSPDNLRDFLNAHQSSIHYVTVDTPTILQDLDTPGDYQKYLPRKG